MFSTFSKHLFFTEIPKIDFEIPTMDFQRFSTQQHTPPKNGSVRRHSIRKAVARKTVVRCTCPIATGWTWPFGFDTGTIRSAKKVRITLWRQVGFGQCPHRLPNGSEVVHVTFAHRGAVFVSCTTLPSCTLSAAKNEHSLDFFKEDVLVLLVKGSDLLSVMAVWDSGALSNTS